MSNDSGTALTHDEKILWMMNAMECTVTKEYYAVLERLHPLSYEELDVLDRNSCTSNSTAEDLREALLSDVAINDIIIASLFAGKYERHQSITDILGIISCLRSLDLSINNLDVHIRADIRHVGISNAGPSVNNCYIENPGMVRLIDEYPERMVEITGFRAKRRTNDAELLREALGITKPLADGTL
jgi:hypothetical protein